MLNTVCVIPPRGNSQIRFRKNTKTNRLFFPSKTLCFPKPRSSLTNKERFINNNAVIPASDWQEGVDCQVVSPISSGSLVGAGLNPKRQGIGFLIFVLAVAALVLLLLFSSFAGSQSDIPPLAWSSLQTTTQECALQLKNTQTAINATQQSCRLAESRVNRFADNDKTLIIFAFITSALLNVILLRLWFGERLNKSG